MKKVANNDGIAGWKIDHPIERWLSRMADKSEFAKKLYVAFYRVFDREYFNKGLKFIDKNIEIFVGQVSPSQRKAYIVDMVYSLHRFGCMFDEYFLFDYPNLNAKGRESFITDKIRWGYYSRMNLEENKDIFNNKRKAYECFGKYYRRELLEIETDADAEKFYDFLSRNSRFIVKPFNGSGGRGIFIADAADYNDKESLFAFLRGKGHVVVEQLIIQAPEMAVFSKSSVNTVRITTLKLKDRVVLFQPILRTGLGDSVIDNSSAGGIVTPLDPNLGIAITKGIDKKGGTYVCHPDSKVVFPGFQVPKWDEAVALVTELAGIVEGNHYVGWDIALTENGWVMIEGNPRGQLGAQVATRKGIRHELEAYIAQM